MSLIILELVFRMGFLSMGIQYLFSEQTVSYLQQKWLGMLPFLFKSLSVIVLMQFKVELIYIERSLTVPSWVNFMFMFFYSFDILAVLSMPLIDCANLPDREDYILGISLQISYLLPLSIASLVLLIKLRRKFTFGDLKIVIKRLYVLEVMA